MQRTRARVLAGLLGAGLVPALLMASAGSASAHERRGGPKYHFVVGWGDEPAYSGYKNSVQVRVADATDNAVTDITDTLKVDVSTGDQKTTMTLEPAFVVGRFGTPGDYRAYFVPTRAGVYTFRVNGTIHGDTIDETFTSSDTTFDSIKDATEVQFPAKDPTSAQLAQRLDRELPRLSTKAALASASTKAQDDAGSAKVVGIVGIVMGALGLGVGGLALAKRK
ncbi:MAG TPA: hypothetical protein VFA94_02685 [Acidimicrobiales bacterium]|nr:hypothetical protein [Acidimicrobiales bacterium]